MEEEEEPERLKGSSHFTIDTRKIRILRTCLIHDDLRY